MQQPPFFLTLRHRATLYMVRTAGRRGGWMEEAAARLVSAPF